MPDSSTPCPTCGRSDVSPGAALAAMRKTHGHGTSGPINRNGGRPRKLPRCACGKFTVARMPKKHVCETKLQVTP
jgi:hypothetical protein